MHSRAHQNFLRGNDILGMCMDERKEELTNGRKLWWQTVHGCTCAEHLSLFLSLSFPYFSSSIHSIAIILLEVCYCLFSFLFYFFFVNPISYITALTLHSFLAFLLFHAFTIHSDRVSMHSRYQLMYIIKHWCTWKTTGRIILTCHTVCFKGYSRTKDYRTLKFGGIGGEGTQINIRHCSLLSQPQVSGKKIRPFI